MSQPVNTHLNNVLADAVVFYYKLHNYHWFVKGPRFFVLHEQYEALYTEWAGHLDEVAERILQLHGSPHPTLAACIAGSAIAEESSRPSEGDMIKNTIADLKTQSDRIHKAIETAEEAGDRTTSNILDDIIDSIHKHIWMFEAHQG